jgi:hypothetical protein
MVGIEIALSKLSWAVSGDLTMKLHRIAMVCVAIGNDYYTIRNVGIGGFLSAKSGRCPALGRSRRNEPMELQPSSLREDAH